MLNIENLYQTFENYQLNGKIEKCPCGCISEEEERKIYSKPLRELNAEDIGFYSNKAMTTWGNKENYKHFLPRIIEIYKKDKSNGWIDLDTIHNKLKSANWKEWNKAEQESINKFVEGDWDELVNQSENEISFFDLDSYLRYIEFERLMEIWEFPKNKMALRNFVEFFYLNGNKLFYENKKVKIYGEDRKAALKKLIERKGLKESLETTFFKYESLEAEYADKASAVLQMIEGEF